MPETLPAQHNFSEHLPGGPVDDDPYFTELRLRQDGNQGVKYYDQGSDSFKYVGLDTGEELALIAGDSGEPRMPFVRKTDEQGKTTDTPFSDYLRVKSAPGVEKDSAESAIFKSNLETLEGKGELGKAFAELYKGAVEEDPRLADIYVWSLGSKTEKYEFLEHTGGVALHKDANGLDRHGIVMNTDDGLGHYQRLLSSRRASAQISAEKVGITSEITPQQLASFIFLHELGHIVDYMDNAPDKATLKLRRDRDMATLPIPGMNPAQLAQKLADDKGWFFENVRGWHDKFGVSSIKELMNIQERAYHDVETEDIPDQFAARVMKKLGLV